MLRPPKERPTPKLTSFNFANFLRNKVDNIRESSVTAPPPVTVNRHALPLSSFQPVLECEIIKLLHSTPPKPCSLDPIPTWLLKRLSTCIAPVICRLCNLSMQSGIFPSQLERARVLPLLKKPALDPDTCSSYRPISNLSFISKLSGASPPMYRSLISSRISSPPTDHFILLKPLFCLCTILLFVPLYP